MSVDINSVRSTVLAICNKNNYGYVSPADFNLYAKQAQLDIFNGYMKLYNYYINKENEHTAGTDFADLAEKTREDIEIFLTGSASLTFTGVDPDFLISTFTSPTNVYHLNSLIYAPAGGRRVKIDKVSRSEMAALVNANLCAPTVEYPIFSEGSSNIGILPSIIQADVDAIYIRYPVDPEWAYVTLTNGEPMYDVTNSTDFELSKEEEPVLVNKILEMAGISIREPEVYKTAQSNDNTIQ